RAPIWRRRKAFSTSGTSSCAERRRSSGSLPLRSNRAAHRPASSSRVCGSSSPARSAGSRSATDCSRALPSAARSTATLIITATTCACAAPSFRSTASTTCSASYPSSAPSSAAATKACSASPMKWSVRRARRCCGLIRFPPWRRACCANSSSSRAAMLPCRRKATPNRPSVIRASNRPQQDVPLPAERELDDALRREVTRAEHHFLVDDRNVVDLETAALDLPAGLTLRCDQADVNRGVEHAENGLKLAARNFDGRQRLGKRALLEGAPRGFGRLFRGGAAVQQRGRLGGQNFFRLVQLLPFQQRKTSDFVERKFGKQLEQAADIAVLAIAPELPVIVGTHGVRIEPDRAGLGLAHLAAGGGRQQRRRQREQLNIVQPAAEIDAVDDVAPLVGSAHLQNAAVALVQLHEIVGLQNHVVEFEEGQGLLALEPQLHRIECEHLVDGEVAPDVAQ